MRMKHEADDAQSDSVCPFGDSLSWQWSMRKELFYRVHEGIQFDAIGLIGVKPEAAALRCARRLPGRTTLDAFAGIGGSAIAMARAGKRVLSTDLNADRLRMAKHNAGIYRVADRILFARADVRRILPTVRVDSIYLDPPWGGMEAAERPRFGLRDYCPPADELLTAALDGAPNVALSVPPNFDFSEIGAHRPTFVDPVTYQDEVLYFDVFFLS